MEICSLILIMTLKYYDLLKNVNLHKLYGYDLKYICKYDKSQNFRFTKLLFMIH